MKFEDKKRIHDKLLGVTHIEADRELLKKVSPGHKKLSQSQFNPRQYASELLWILLDLASAEEIIANRRSLADAKEKAAEEKAEAERKEAEEKAAAENNANSKPAAAIPSEEPAAATPPEEPAAATPPEESEKIKSEPKKQTGKKESGVKNPEEKKS